MESNRMQLGGENGAHSFDGFQRPRTLCHPDVKGFGWTDAV
jgi:hypothetical protein